MKPIIRPICFSLLLASPALWAMSQSTNEMAALVDSRHTLHKDTNPLPNFVWASSDPSRKALRASAAALSDAQIAQFAVTQLQRYAPLYALNNAAQRSAKIHAVHRLAEGTTIVQLAQHVQGIEIFSRRMSFLLDNRLQLHAISGSLVPQVSTAKAATKLNAQQAIAQAYFDLHHEKRPKDAFTRQKHDKNYQWYGLDSADAAKTAHRLTQPIRVKKVWYPQTQALESAFYIELNSENQHYAYVVSAKTGDILLKHSMTRHESAGFSYRVYANATDEMPYDSSLGNSLTPLLSAPTQTITPVLSNLIKLNSGPISTSDPWLPNNATQTIGNNVEAYADLQAPDGFSLGDLYGQVSAPLQFNYRYQFALPSSLKYPKQIHAAITQAFYTTNFVHDWLYDHGFDEISGNGQQDNFSRGGIEADPMHVEIMDYSGIDNADMSTPLDGESPTMQLYLWSNPGKKALMVTINSSTQNYMVTSASFGAQKFNLNNKKIVLVDDGVALQADGSLGSTADACQTPLLNAAELKGAIALIDRGDCLFVEKVKNAQDAGAVGVLMANNKPDAMIVMGNSGDPIFDKSVILPVLGINQDAGLAIKQALTAASTVTALMQLKQLPQINSALDNTIVIHEWAHFLSDRLVWLDNNQGNSMAEGWSDFLTLIAIVKESDRLIPGNEQFQAPYAMGQYANSGILSDYRYGIRRYPYSTNLKINPLTLKHISLKVPLPANIPIAPGASTTGADNTEVHNGGEVWASMLWEVYVGLLNDTQRLSFKEAQNRMLDYLVASLKMTPANPTFLEARDALLVVAKARDLADYQIFWQAFAKRGAGVDAVAPPQMSKTQRGVVESFDLP